jgi:outer membrane protein OmpA-like peptidoglycan-associated protein
MNILSNLSDYFSDQNIAHLAKTNNESADKIKKALSLLSPSLVSGIIKRASNEAGMNLLYNQIQSFSFDIADFNNPTKDAAIIAAGDKVLNTLLPSFKGPVSNFVSSQSGLRNSVVSKLCSTSMAGLVSSLKKTVAEKNLTPESLTALIYEQRENMLNAVPDEIKNQFIDIMGFRNFLRDVPISIPATESASPTATPPTTFQYTESNEKSSFDLKLILKWAAIAILVGGLGWAGYYLWNQRSSNDAEPIAQEVADSTVSESSTPQTQTSAVDTTKSIATSQDPMQAYLADTTLKKGKIFKLDNVDFLDNTTQLKPESVPIVQNLSSLLQKYPTTEIKIIGYANDAVLPMTNKSLSNKRVYALKQQLIDKGINFVRIDAESRGTGVNPRDSTNRNRTPLREIYVKFVNK